MAKNIIEKGVFEISADNAMLIVAIPSGSEIEKVDNKSVVNGIVIAYK